MGAVTQLAKNVDQNRLSLLAQSANAEVMAIIRSKVNLDPDSQIFQKFRSVFPADDGTEKPLRQSIVLLNNFEPQQTLKMAANEGYKLKVKSRAVLTAYREAPAKSVSAYNAYLDVFSQAYRENYEENLIEAHERRDVRLVDLRHSLDKYAVFVKNYCPDLNNPRRRLIIEGIEDSGPFISHAFFGNLNYPECADPEKRLWFDVFTGELPKFPGFKTISGSTALTAFAGGTAPSCLYSAHVYDFEKLEGPVVSDFYKVNAVIKVYEKFVNEAADGCMGSIQPFATKEALRQKCKKAMDASNSNAASYAICEDFYNNFKSGGDGDYSGCSGFMKILYTCIKNWKYVYGYTDAASIWKIDQVERPNLPAPQNWVTALAYCGLATTTAEFRGKGPYFSEYLDEVGGKDFNPERIKVGKMAKLYGENCDRKLFVEGPAFLRYFKIAFLDDFTTTIDFYSGPKDVNPEPVPLNFYRYDKNPKTFLNKPLTKALPTPGVVDERYLMSRAIDNFPINCFLGNSVSIFDGDGKEITINPFTYGSPNFENPRQKSGSNHTALKFGRLIDFKTVSWNYPNTELFLQDRVRLLGGVKTLFVDGVMYIENGDLDLSDIKQFYGKGLVYLGRGNCLIGNFSRCTGRQGDSVRFYLRQGDYIIKSDSDTVEIEASLAAFYYPFGSKSQVNQGSLLLSSKKDVTIVGNLLVDYLFTEAKGSMGLVDGGTLTIKHDPVIYDPAAEYNGEKLDPYRVSIGPVKTLFSLNAGGKTF
ncbi:MAG: hypothetical protein Kow0029_06690 [Candidatus Rifleibacteriota bacterium]